MVENMVSVISLNIFDYLVDDWYWKDVRYSIVLYVFDIIGSRSIYMVNKG